MSDSSPFSQTWRKAEYDRRNKNSKQREIEALKLIRHLNELWDETDPVNTHLTTEQKDVAARNALLLTGILSDLMAGWATDHIIGKAMHAPGLSPKQGGSENNRSGDIGEQQTSKKCIFEQSGRTISWQFGPPVDHNLALIRQTLLELIDGKSTCLPKDMAYVVSDAIRAINHGSLPPIFTPKKIKWAKRSYYQLVMQMKAVEHVYYRVEIGEKRTEAIDKVAQAYGRDYETVEGWISVLKESLKKDNYYESRLEHARRMGFSYDNPNSTESLASRWAADQEYGASALTQDGITFRRLAVRVN